MAQIRIQSPFPDWPLDTRIDGIKIEKCSNHWMQIQVNGLEAKPLKLNELLTLTITEQT